MARCSDCNGVVSLYKNGEYIIDVGRKGTVESIICKDCWKLLEKSGAKVS